MARRAKPTKAPKPRRLREPTPDAALAARVHGRMPSKDEIVTFIRDAGLREDGTKVGKREIARAFGITAGGNAQKIPRTWQLAARRRDRDHRPR
jgi:hypothetical protein